MGHVEHDDRVGLFLEADAGHAGAYQGASARQLLSRGASAAEQVSEPAPELILVNTWFVLALRDVLAGSVVSFGRVAPPPRSGLLRLQLVQALPFLSGDEHNGVVARAHQGDRAPASFYLVGDRFKFLSFPDRLLSHGSSMTPGETARNDR